MTAMDECSLIAADTFAREIRAMESERRALGYAVAEIRLDKVTGTMSVHRPWGITGVHGDGIIIDDPVDGWGGTITGMAPPGWAEAMLAAGYMGDPVREVANMRKEADAALDHIEGNRNRRARRAALSRSRRK